MQFSWSPDGRRIAFVSWGEHREVQIVEPATGEISTVARDVREPHGPAWSPDGTWLAFTVGNPELPASDVYLVRADGSGLQRLTTSGTALGPVCRPVVP